MPEVSIDSLFEQYKDDEEFKQFVLIEEIAEDILAWWRAAGLGYPAARELSCLKLKVGEDLFRAAMSRARQIKRGKNI